MGAGGIGGNIAGYLSLAGVDVTVVDHWAAHIDAIKERGLTLTSADAEDVAHPAALHVGEAWSVRPIDVLVLGVKAYDNDWCVALLKPYLKPDAVVVSAQNGVQEDRLTETVGFGRVIGAVVLLSGATVGPGHVKLTSPVQREHSGAPDDLSWRGSLLIGELHGRTTRRLLEMQALLQQAIGAPITNNIWGELWCKLTMNTMSNPINAVLGGTSADVRLEPGPRSVSLRAAAECVAVGQALGFDIPPIAGIEADRFIDAANGVGLEGVVRDWEATGHRLKGIVGSMPTDMRRGRKTEADSFSGYVVRKAAEIGMEVPANASVYRLVREIEAGQRKPGPENLALMVGLDTPP